MKAEIKNYLVLFSQNGSMEINKTIIEGCLNGDRRAQESLYRHAYGRMMSICARYGLNHTDSLTIYNDTMLQVFQQLSKFDTEQQLIPWIKKMLVFRLIDAFRKKNTSIEDAWPIYQSGEEWEASSSAFLPDHDLNASYLLELVRQLPLATREVFNLYAIDGFTHVDIAKMLHISVGTSKWHLNQARSQLQAKIKKTEIVNPKSRYA